MEKEEQNNNIDNQLGEKQNKQFKPASEKKINKPESAKVDKEEKNNAVPKKRIWSNYNKNNYRKNNYNSRANVSFKKVSIVIPLYNEEESLKPLYVEIKKGLSQVRIDYELLLVDDGSSDNSLQVIKELATKDPKIKYISFRKNYGKSAALNVGFRNVSGDAVITMDADLQDDPNEIKNLLTKLSEGYDIVSGWKKSRKDSFIKNKTSKIYNAMTNLVSGTKLHDMNCGLKAYRREVVDSIEIYGEFHRYIPVLAKWQGFTRITEIPVKHQARKWGKTKFGISRFYKGFVDLVTVTFITRYVTRPMHLFGFWGALSFVIGFCIESYLTFEKLVHHKGLENRPLMFLGILLIIFGVQLFSTGLVGELIVHNSRKDKEYIVKAANV